MVTYGYIWLHMVVWTLTLDNLKWIPWIYSWSGLLPYLTNISAFQMWKVAGSICNKGRVQTLINYVFSWNFPWGGQGFIFRVDGGGETWHGLTPPPPIEVGLPSMIPPPLELIVDWYIFNNNNLNKLELSWAKLQTWNFTQAREHCSRKNSVRLYRYISLGKVSIKKTLKVMEFFFCLYYVYNHQICRKLWRKNWHLLPLKWLEQNSRSWKVWLTAGISTLTH